MLPTEPVEALVLGEALYGVAESCAWQAGIVLVEVVGEQALVFLPYFAEHPADRFMDEVVWVIDECGAEGKGGGEDAVADEVECGDYGDSLFPEAIAPGEAVEQGDLIRGGEAKVWS